MFGFVGRWLRFTRTWNLVCNCAIDVFRSLLGDFECFCLFAISYSVSRVSLPFVGTAKFFRILHSHMKPCVLDPKKQEEVMISVLFIRWIFDPTV